MNARAYFLSLLCCLMLPASANALMIQTPLTLSTEGGEWSVGDTITFTVEPMNESVAQQFGGKTYRVEYQTDAPQGEGDEPEIGDAGTVTLAADGTGSFTWTVPADADDHHVWISVMDGENGIGSTQVQVGDAEPMMYALNNEAAEGGEVDSSPEPASDAGASEGAGRNVPGAGMLLVGAAVIAATLLAVRRRA